MSSPLTGLVLRVDAKVCHVEIDGTVHLLPLRGRLFEERGDSKRPVAVGDIVRVTLGDDGGAIDAVLPRTRRPARETAGEGGREQILAANVTLALATCSIAEPPFDALLIDRILAGAEREGVAAAVVVTKVDRDRKQRVPQIAARYRAIGYPVFPVSLRDAQQAPALAELRAALRGQIAVLCGLSGVGKTSLLNDLVPGSDMKVGAVGRVHKGKHTTTHAQLVRLPDGGHIVDTPGIRSFGLFGAAPGDVAHLFVEFRQHVGRCDYRNCLHLVEPGCAVRAAVAAGAIAPERFASYAALVEELQ